MLSHAVFFGLRDDSREACERLVASCRKHLRDHPGVLFFSVGCREERLAREVNDLEFQVALHVVFEDMAAHETYQAAPEHALFIEESEANWAEVRVFDSQAGS